MTDTDLVDLAEAYFRALDDRDVEALVTLLNPDCALDIETHDIHHSDAEAIRTLFATRWQGPMLARHHDFTHTPSAATGRIACQFTVTYSGDDAPEPKSNANVFTARDGKITRIQVYMAGANSIRT